MLLGFFGTSIQFSVFVLLFVWCSSFNQYFSLVAMEFRCVFSCESAGQSVYGSRTSYRGTTRGHEGLRGPMGAHEGLGGAAKARKDPQGPQGTAGGRKGPQGAARGREGPQGAREGLRGAVRGHHLVGKSVLKTSVTFSCKLTNCDHFLGKIETRKSRYLFFRYYLVCRRVDYPGKPEVDAMIRQTLNG
jgi:hypothetical protein